MNAGKVCRIRCFRPSRLLSSKSKKNISRVIMSSLGFMVHRKSDYRRVVELPLSVPRTLTKALPIIKQCVDETPSYPCSVRQHSHPWFFPWIMPSSRTSEPSLHDRHNLRDFGGLYVISQDVTCPGSPKNIRNVTLTDPHVPSPMPSAVS